jgi:hypothetical protein
VRAGASRDGGAIILDAVSVQYREEPCRGALNRVAARLRAVYGIADRRRERLEPAPDPGQLSLAV